MQKRKNRRAPSVGKFQCVSTVFIQFTFPFRCSSSNWVILQTPCHKDVLQTNPTKMEEFPWLITLLIFFLTLLTLIKHARKKTPKLPPGPPPLPIIGNLHQLASNKTTLPHHLFAQLAHVHGPIMHVCLGAVPTIIVSSADMAKEVMRAHDVALCSRPSLLLGEHLYYGCTDIALSPYGEYWRQVRKIATLELFTAKRVQSFRPVREEEVDNLVRGLAMEEGCVVNLSQKLFALAFDITSRITFNKKGKEQEEFRAFIGDVSEMSSGFSICDLYPSIKFLPYITGMKKRCEDIVRRADNILDPIIHDHISKSNIQKQQQSGGDDDYYKDLVDVLLTFYNPPNSSSHASQFFLTMENIKSIVLELFMAGSETASTTVEWAMSLLLKNPRVMAKAQKEIRQALKLQGKEMVDETCLNDLKYLRQVIKETLRLHPPVPLLLPRESMDRCEIQGYEIPPKVRILINVWAIGRDPKYWTEPERFYPERFDDSTIDYKGNHFGLIPFGAGRRMCPGLGLGVANIDLALATLLYHFEWKLPNEIRFEDLNMDEGFGTTARRKHDLFVIPTLHPFSPLKRA